MKELPNTDLPSESFPRLVFAAMAHLRIGAIHRVVRTDRVAEIREIFRNLVVVSKLLGILEVRIRPFAGDGGAKDG